MTAKAVGPKPEGRNQPTPARSDSSRRTPELTQSPPPAPIVEPEEDDDSDEPTDASTQDLLPLLASVVPPPLPRLDGALASSSGAEAAQSRGANGGAALVASVALDEQGTEPREPGSSNQPPAQADRFLGPVRPETASPAPNTRTVPGSLVVPAKDASAEPGAVSAVPPGDHHGANKVSVEPAEPESASGETNLEGDSARPAVRLGLSGKELPSAEPVRVRAEDPPGLRRTVKRDERASGIDGAKNTPGPMRAEQTNPLRLGAEQTLPGAAVNAPPGLEHRQSGSPGSGGEGRQDSASSWPVLSGTAPSSAVAFPAAAKEVEGLSGVAAVERLQGQIAAAAVEFKQVKAESMRVVLRPDGQTEMELQLSLRNGQIEIEAQVRRGDFQLLSTHWTQLQQSLSAQGVRLGVLQESGSFPEPDGGQSWTGQQQDPPRERVFGEGGTDRPIRPTNSAAGAREGRVHSVPGTGRSWETWA